MAAIRGIKNVTSANGIKTERVLVQPMMSGLCEALVGYFVDRDIGPMVMLAAGGVMAEAYRDRSLHMAPVDHDEAWDMIGRVNYFMAHARPRVGPPPDYDALVNTIVRLSRLADDPTVLEAEINPLIVKEGRQGVVAVDALVKLAGKA
jgi:succinyl-CoA synthetase beta subunit